ncbi:hypothetical protein [Novosphingobium colocasiae]|uniref:hypothetical protein n=1 Tax=Novosphingobium colocasiae TaxID=1256513 RepID=UPI0035ADF497
MTPKARESVVLLAVALVMAVLVALLSGVDDALVSRTYFLAQDRPSALFAIAALIAAALIAPRTPGGPQAMPRPRRVRAVAAAVAVLLWAGTWLVMANYPVSRDEHMALFDAHVLASGHLAQPLAPSWQPFAKALVPDFLMDVPGHRALISSYLPANAALRALFGKLGDPALLNPLLTAAGLLALWRIALRLFPTCPGAVWVCLGGYLLSAQVLVTGMTGYAMTAHLTLNLVWLALFLRGGRWETVAALAIGWLAMGLHQIVFHPLFAAPFILTLLAQRRWRTFAVYALGYGLAALFWASYPGLVLREAVVLPAGGDGGPQGLIGRALAILATPQPYALPLMAYNLLRFAVWTPLFVLPLAALAWPAVRGNRGPALPLMAGVILTLGAIAVLMPYQGHGWGYRYLHPVLGNVILLAGIGYQRWSQNAPRRAAATTAWLALATAGLLPFLVWQAHVFVRPYAAMSQWIGRQRADFVVLDTEYPPQITDQVRNLPDLSNRPLIFSSYELSGPALVELCRRGTVLPVPRGTFRAMGLLPADTPDNPLFARRMAPLNGRPCLVAMKR